MIEAGLRRASDAMRSGRFDEAVALCRDLLKQLPNSPEAIATLGICLAQTGQPGAGLEWLSKAVLLQPRDVPVLIEASICARLAGRHFEAVDFGRRAVDVQPENPRARCFYGLALCEAQRLEEGLLQMREAARLAPTNPQVLHNFGLALERCGLEQEALAQFRAVVKMLPQALPSRLAAGQLLLKYGRPKAALDQAQLCLAQDAQNQGALQLAARACVALSLHEEAVRFVERALAANPDDIAALVMKGFRLQASGDVNASKVQFEKALKQNPLQGAAYWGVWQGTRAGQGDLPKVEHMVSVAEQLSPGSLERAYAYFAAAKCFVDLELDGEAMGCYDQANREAAVAQRVHQRYDPDGSGKFLAATRALFSPEFLERHASVAELSDRPIFIVGMMRSGTTLMEQILCSHPEVTAAGELPFWTSLAPTLVDPQTGELQTDVVKRFQSEYLALLARYSVRGRVTDKMPENSRFLGLIRLLFPNARVIHLSRDMADVGLSIYMTPYEVSPPFAHVHPHIVEACRSHQELMRFWSATLPQGSILDVRYSELVEQPEREIRRVLTHCGLPWDEGCLRHTENDRAVITPSSSQVRQPIYRSSQGKWKRFAPYLGELLRLVDDGGQA